METNSNGYYKTNNFREAVYLRSVGVLYIKTEWTIQPDIKNIPRDTALFVFKTPSDEVRSAWLRGEDNGVRAILDAADFFRDEIKRRDR